MRLTGVFGILFGIFMVLVYLGMAVLMAINYFGLSTTGPWSVMRWVFAAVLAVYGLYRAYRLIKGEHTYGMRIYDQSDEDAYTTYSKSQERKIDNDDEKK